jgi:hypothetical protein
MRILNAIRFAHVRTSTDMLCTTYTVDIPFKVGSRVITPTKMTLNKDKSQITVEFDDKSSHVLWYNEDCELFYIEKDNGKTQDKVKPGRVRQRKDTE